RRQQLLRLFGSILAGLEPTRDPGVVTADHFRQEPIDVPLLLYYRLPGQDAEPARIAPASGDGARLAVADVALRRALAGPPQARRRLRAGEPTLLREALELATRHGPEPVTDVFLVPTESTPDSGAGEFIAV